MADTLGSIVWFGVGGAVRIVDDHRRVVDPVLVTAEDLAQWFNELHLDLTFLPPAVRSIDAVKKACSQAVSDYVREDGTTVHLSMREVLSDKERLVRHVIAEETLPRQQEIRSTKVAEIKFYRERRLHRGIARGTYRIRHRIAKLPEPDYEQVESLIKAFYVRFNEYYGHLTAPALRGVIGNDLVSLDAILVRPQGGIYFCHNDVLPTTDRLAEVLRRMGPGCTLHTIPLPDTEEQRRMLITAYESEVEEAVRVLLADITAYLATHADSASQTRYRTLAKRYQALSARAERHTTLLRLPSDRTGLALEQAWDALSELEAQVRTR